MHILNLIKYVRLIPKADRKKIHEYIFREGVMVAKKDFNQPKHGEIDTKNLYVRFIHRCYDIDTLTE